jgi:HAD superfamily hydrolase (TIGR01509 family)
VTVRAVVLEFDGVIANSEPLHFRGFRDVLAEAGVVLTEHEYYARYLGYDDAGAFEAIAADRGARWPSQFVSAMIERKSARLVELERDASVLFPGAAEMIRRLAGGGPVAIASGALRYEIVRVLDRAELSRHIRTIVAAGDTRSSKPAPDPYLLAVEQLSATDGGPYRPGECVAVEDSRWGLESALGAGLLAVGVTHTYPAAELGAATAVVASLDALTWEYLRSLG